MDRTKLLTMKGTMIRCGRISVFKLQSAPHIHHWGNLNDMPRPAHTVSTSTTLILVVVLLLAFFPNLFHLIWSTPLSFLAFTKPEPTPPPQFESTGIMSWSQKQFTLTPRSRGSYLITDQVVQALPEIRNYKVGLLNLFIQHTSCALSLNENCKWFCQTCDYRTYANKKLLVDTDVREDMSDALDRIAPEEGPKGEALYRHE